MLIKNETILTANFVTLRSLESRAGFHGFVLKDNEEMYSEFVMFSCIIVRVACFMKSLQQIIILLQNSTEVQCEL